MTCFQRFPGKSPIFPMMAPPKIVSWKSDGRKENAIYSSVPFLHNFHIKSTWSINCVQHKIALGAEEKMSPARSISQGDTSSELPRSPHRPTCLALGPPQKTGQAAVHAQTARRARHHSARKEEHIGLPQIARASLWRLGPIFKKPLHWRGASREMAQHPRWSEKRIHACPHMHTEPLKAVSQGCPPSWLLAWLRTSIATLSSPLLRHKHI